MGGVRRARRSRATPRGWPWAAFNSVDFQGPPDLLLVLPATAFWVAWLSHRLVGSIASHASLVAWRSGAGVLSGTLGGLVLAATAWYMVTPAFRFALLPGETLTRQEAVVANILRSVGPEGTVDGFGADVVFAISERKSPTRFLRLGRIFQRFVHLVDPRGCQGVLRSTIDRNPEVVVISSLAGVRVRGFLSW